LSAFVLSSGITIYSGGDVFEEVGGGICFGGIGSSSSRSIVYIGFYFGCYFGCYLKTCFCGEIFWVTCCCGIAIASGGLYYIISN
jgi:hypothetical protein